MTAASNALDDPTPARPPVRLRAADLPAFLADPYVDEATSLLDGGPGLVLVDAIDVPAGLADAIDTRRPRTWVLAALDAEGSTPAGLDEVVDVLLTTRPLAPRPWVSVADLDGAVAELAAATATSPMAAGALAELLRIGERSSLQEAITLESLTYSTLLAGPEFAAWRASRAIKGRGPEPSPLVRVERFGDEVHVSLARPRKHNAYSAAMRDELVEALRFVLLDPSTERVVLRGDGPSFSAGGDLDEFGSAPDPATAHLIRWTRSAAALVDRCAARIEAHLHGACIGAGIEIPAAAGRVVADPATRMVLPEVAMGLVPGAGGTATIPRRIGRHRTCWMGLTGITVDATTALHWGLVDEVVGQA